MMVPMNGNSPLEVSFYRGRGLIAILLALLILGAFCVAAARAQSSPNPAGHATLIVFSDRPMEDTQWTALLADLKSGVVHGGDATRALDRDAEFLRGDRIELGLRVNFPIVVYLHGECSLAPVERKSTLAGALGWVMRVDGVIEPFVHVDCNRIAQVLTPQAMWMTREQRILVMAEAIARVVLHEWIHVVTQSPVHAETGIFKRQFNAADLVGGR
jgi:hypothetical protein